MILNAIFLINSILIQLHLIHVLRLISQIILNDLHLILLNSGLDLLYNYCKRKLKIIFINQKQEY